jgi:hypothetical protein
MLILTVPLQFNGITGSLEQIGLRVHERDLDIKEWVTAALASSKYLIDILDNGTCPCPVCRRLELTDPPFSLRLPFFRAALTFLGLAFPPQFSTRAS